MSEEQVRFLGDLHRLEVRPGDRFVLSFPGRVSYEVAQRYKEYWASEFGADARLIIIGDGGQLGVISTVATEAT